MVAWLTPRQILQVVTLVLVLVAVAVAGHTITTQIKAVMVVRVSLLSGILLVVLMTLWRLAERLRSMLVMVLMG